ncbi:DnaD domain protein [Staphylococcus gallinarum]|uniref:DnaD domain protein n=1 Tax=Staphylococcus gallinarum TaxID=1293 RepID=UPI000E677282|nr:DnaD domain protein [Staphylococcus gallinarum]RIL23404.1 DnaD domain protein [Staphylococcus gallinarum]
MCNKEYEGNFYKVFLFLFYDEDYSNLPVNAKLMYTLLSDKNDLSKQTAEQGNTQFFDEKNRLYSIYSNKDLATDLKINIKSVPRLKKQLKEKGLLVEERQGLGLSNRIYPKQPYADGFFYKYDISKWFLLPKDLFAYKYYNELDNQTKVLFAILYNTFRYSEKLGQYIHNGKIYCSLTYNKIQEITGFRREKIKEMKEELRKKHLITYENGGFSKADRFYVHLPQVTKNMEITDSNTWNHLKKKPIKIKYNNVKLISDIKNDPKIKGYKLRHIKEVTKRNQWKSHNGTNGSNKTEPMEVTKRNSNNTYIIKPYFNNLYINKTTTKENDKVISGSSLIKIKKNKSLLTQIQNEFNIKITTQYKKSLINLFDQLDTDIIEYAIEYTSLNATSPKQYLVRILENWINADIKTVEQAKSFKQVTKSKQKLESKEMTPQWLLDRKEQDNKENEMTINQKDYEYYQNVKHELDNLIKDEFEKDLQEIDGLNNDVKAICDVELNKLSEEEKQECFENKEEFINKKLEMVREVAKFKKELHQKWGE